MTNVPMTKTSLRVPTALFKAAKIHAVKQDTTFQDIVIAAVTKYLKGVK